ncbi:MAG: deoxyguanosinetriphosphate triphosphohydrolase [Hyphomicrobiaceae bacterium]|nr:deoxyguanosinetriphosphate triphosphohydrolase [Hyphomicrobiaceae bacterium]MCC0024554.1 deoxyguanosinetriphosphate triphosphohydrolase [Hyphomicrobiaceae bacterium]
MTVPYAEKPERSRGRFYSTSDSPTRSEFQRDRDRIIHSTAFRRLQHKTQVFLHHEGHHFRTRLTHTLEVSQIARSIARALDLNEDLAEAVALAHDLGHPPFGHAGERALDRAMRGFGGFDHNVQALRTVVLLENRYAEHDGLNLTWETLDGIFKHNGPVGPKALAMLDFLPDAQKISNKGYSSLEAQAAAIADDIAYNSHDIDDAVRAGILTLTQLRGVPLVGAVVEEVLGRYPDAELGRQTHEVQRRLITRTIEGVIATAKVNIETANPESADAVRELDFPLIAFPDAMASDERELKQFLFANVYREENVMRAVTKSEQVVERLFDKYMKTGDLPSKWRTRLDASASGTERARHVCDFIAGMTDPYALAEYQRLFDEIVEFR